MWHVKTSFSILSCNETWLAGKSSINGEVWENHRRIFKEARFEDLTVNQICWYCQYQSISQKVRGHSSQEHRPVADSDAHPSSLVQYQVMTNSLVWFHSCHRGVSAVSRNWLHCCEIWKLKIEWSLRNWHELALKLKSSGASPTFGLNHILPEGPCIESPSNRQ
jgi:hypothetical protein